MFRFHKTLDVITLFHRPSIPASVRVHTILKQASANITETATVDPAANHSQQNKAQRNEFELDVVEDPPTSDQLRSMLEYIGGKKASDLVNGARDEADAMRKLRDSGESFVRPVTVDWSNGRVVIGDDESEIMRLVRLQSNGD